jgi:MoxR-like ATPase
MTDRIIFDNRLDLSDLHQATERLYAETGKIIIGQQKMISLIWIAILSDGHILIEGVPGLAKTLTAKAISRCISANFSRIQFTPDLMPSDVTGTNVFNIGKSEFRFNFGPIFANLVLIDEINRAPAKTQSALFEVMEERQVTVDGISYPVDQPFIVIATQNPIEHEGTYRLPEAQIDRFLFKIKINYPDVAEENLILENNHNRHNKRDINDIKPVMTAEQVVQFQQTVAQVHVDEKIRNYIVTLIQHTRSHAAIYLGASPRASILLMNAAKAYAAINKRDFVIPEDVQYVIYPLLEHRIILSPEKELEGRTIEDVVKMIVQSVDIPR